MKGKKNITDRDATVNKFNVACKQLEDIIEFLPDAILVVDTNKKVLIWNLAIEKMTGISKKDIIGMDYYACGIPFYGEARPFALDLLDNHDAELASKYAYVRRDGNAINAEVFAPMLYGGKGAYLWINASVLLDAEGKRVGTVQSMRDITERKLAQAALLESEQKFKGISSSAKDAIIMLNSEGDIVYWNPAAEKIFGYAEAEVLGKHAHTLLAPEMSREAYSKGSTAFKLTGRGPVVDRTLELTAKRKSGTEFPIELSVSSINLKGKWHAIGIVRDITDHKRTKEALMKAREELEKKVEERTAELLDSNMLLTQEIEWRTRVEDALRESEKRYRALVELSPEMIFIQCEGRFAYINNAGVRLLGALSAKELLGRPVMDYFHPEYHDAVRERIRQLRDERQSVPFIEQRYLRVDGSSFFVEAAAVPTDFEGKPAALVVARDITERKKAEDILRRYSEKLEEDVRERTMEAQDARHQAESANKTKSEFLANMSHELRTPLNAINGFSELMLEGFAGELSEQQRDYLNHIHLSGEHLLSLINDILDLSKVEAGKMELDLDQIVISELLTSTLNLSKEKALKHHLNITSEVGEGVETMVADVRLIKQVLFNLLSNAVKFTPDGGRIMLKVRRAGEGFVEFSVADTGIGIAIEDQKKLFQPFQQLDSSYNKKFAGTGLGLSLCRRIVELHGGRIWLESKEGRGSTFTFTIPFLRT